eukprot:scaffold50633_cov21-Tisochrysis_lutea.AAC.2
MDGRQAQDKGKLMGGTHARMQACTTIWHCTLALHFGLCCSALTPDKQSDLTKGRPSMLALLSRLFLLITRHHGARTTQCQPLQPHTLLLRNPNAQLKKDHLQGNPSISRRSTRASSRCIKQKGNSNGCIELKEAADALATSHPPAAAAAAEGGQVALRAATPLAAASRSATGACSSAGHHHAPGAGFPPAEEHTKCVACATSLTMRKRHGQDPLCLADTAPCE